MPLLQEITLPNNEPKPSYLSMDNFRRGVITIVDKSRIPLNALEVADNAFLYEDGLPGPRPGLGWFGVAVPNGEPIDGFDYYDKDGDIHIVAVAGGVVYRSTDMAKTWDECTGGTTVAGERVEFNQNGGKLYITTKSSHIVLYDGTTVLDGYDELTNPVAPTSTRTGLAGTDFTYRYKVAAVNQIGFTGASPMVAQDVSEERQYWGSTDYLTLEVTPVSGADRYDWFISEDGLDYYYLSSTVKPKFKDDGKAVIIPSMKAPVENTTTGPMVEELVNVGERQYGVRDPDNPYRIWFTGSGNYSGSFSGAYDGGYIDWQPGGKYRPVHVEDYRDGKGDPLATVWCESADGIGTILQMSLEVMTIGDYSITVPSIYRLPGSRGTNAPGSVVNVLNDYLFLNNQAMYNLGSRAQYLGLLSTDEVTGDIRPTLRKINKDAEKGVVAEYWDAKVLVSVPYGTTENNATILYDTERQAWLPYAFKLGFSRFVRMGQQLLALKPGDNRLTEISYSLTTDYGDPFETVIITGIMPLSRNKYEFIWVEEAEMEFSNPRGTINIDLNGFDRSKGFVNIAHRKLQVGYTADEGWNNIEWNTAEWNESSSVASVFSESSLKRYFNVQKELNSVQWRIQSQSIDKMFVLRNLQTWGTDTQAGKPRQWRLNR